MIAAVAAIAVGATTAFFSDTETSAGNVITAGSLDLKVNGFNTPIPAVVTISDLKPSETWWSGPITLEVFNNPGKLYKHIVNEPNDPIGCETVTVREPECVDQGGQWIGGRCVELDPDDDDNYFPRVTWFDLAKWTDLDGDDGIDENEWNVLIADEEVTVHDIASHWMYLGTYGEREQNNKVTIRQSFHLDGAQAGNAYQSDSCVFKEEFMVLQTNAPHPANCVNVTESDEQDCPSFFDVF